MDEEIKKFRILEHYIASFCDERILSINFNPENHEWTIVNIIDENNVFPFPGSPSTNISLEIRILFLDILTSFIGSSHHPQ